VARKTNFTIDHRAQNSFNIASNKGRWNPSVIGQYPGEVADVVAVNYFGRTHWHAVGASIGGVIIPKFNRCRPRTLDAGWRRTCMISGSTTRQQGGF
jgi:hypothetical protein